MKYKNEMNRLLYILTTILGVITAICGAIIPIIYSFVSVELIKILLYIVVITFNLVILLSLLRMLFAPQILIKLAILPLSFVIVIIYLIIYNLQAHMFFLQALSIITPEEYAAVNHDLSKMPSPIFINLGIWISAAPMFIFGIVKTMKLHKGKSKNFDNYIQGKGRIVNVIDTKTKFQTYKIYKVKIEINQYGIFHIIEKELIIPPHMIHVFSINTIVDLFIDPINNKNIYIKTSYGNF